MKLFKKMAVLAAALMMVSVFVSCDNNAEEDSDAAVVAEFDGYCGVMVRDEPFVPVRSEDGDEDLVKPPVDEPRDPDAKVFFYDDNTFKLSYNSEFLEGLEGMEVIDDLRAAAKFFDAVKGTYEGNPEKDGKIKFSVEEEANKNGEFEEANSEAKKFFNVTVEIKDGAFQYNDFFFFRADDKE